MVASLALPACFVVAALLLGRHQIAHFRSAQQAKADERDLFVFTRRRLTIRLLGTTALFAVGLTLGAWELYEPPTQATTQLLIALLLGEVATLIVVAILDLRETAKRARR